MSVHISVTASRTIGTTIGEKLSGPIVIRYSATIGQSDSPIVTIVLTLVATLITFRVRHGRGEVYIDHGRLCVCESVSVRGCMPTLLHGLGCNLGEC